MNAQRFIVAAIGTFVVRTVLNFLFYGIAVQGEYEEIAAAHPGVFREVIAAYFTLDLLVAILIVYLFVKAGSVFGGGVKGGATLGVILAIFAILCDLYWYFSLTVYPVTFFVIGAIYMLIAHAIQGAVAGALYKTADAAGR